jgi:hypothetical protein
MKITIYFNNAGKGYVDDVMTDPIICEDGSYEFFGKRFFGAQTFNVSITPTKKKGEKVLHFSSEHPIVNKCERGMYYSFAAITRRLLARSNKKKLYIRHLS